MTIGHSEEVTVFETAKMRHSNPGILVCLVRVARRLACLGGECKLGDTVGEHLFGVRRVIVVLEVGHLRLRSRVL